MAGTGRRSRPNPPYGRRYPPLRCHIRRRSSPPRRRRRRPPPCAHPPLPWIAQSSISHQAPLVLPLEHTAFSSTNRRERISESIERPQIRAENSSAVQLWGPGDSFGWLVGCLPFAGFWVSLNLLGRLAGLTLPLPAPAALAAQKWETVRRLSTIRKFKFL